MTTYAEGITLLRFLVKAHKELTLAIEQLTEDVLASRPAADLELGAVLTGEERLPPPPPVPDAPPPLTTGVRDRGRRRVASQHPASAVAVAQSILDAHDGQTRAVLRRIQSVDIERHIAAAWLKAEDEQQRAEVLRMLDNASNNRGLDEPAVERLRAMMARVA